MSHEFSHHVDSNNPYPKFEKNSYINDSSSCEIILKKNHDHNRNEYGNNLKNFQKSKDIAFHHQIDENFKDHNKKNKNIQLSINYDSNQINTNNCSEHLNFYPNEKLIDKIINNYGYRWHVIKVILLTFIMVFYTSFVVYHISSFLTILRKKLKTNNMTEEQVGLFFSCITFLFRGIGCFSLIFFIKCFSRKTIIFFSALTISLLSSLLIIELNFLTYTIFIVFGCFFAGLIDPLTLDTICESLPVKFRGFFMCFYTIGTPLSQSVHFLLIKQFYNENNIRLLFVIESGIFFIFMIIILLSYNDSARNLILQNNGDEAFVIINKLLPVGEELNDEEKNILCSEIQSGVNDKYEGTLASLFSRKFLKITLLFMVVIFCIKSSDDGISAVLTLYIQNITKNFNDNFIAEEAIKINCLGLLGPFLAGILVETGCLGRRFSLFFTAMFIFVSFLIFQLNKSNYIVWLGFINIFCNSSASNVLTFIAETYPSILRDISEGFFNTIVSSASLLGNLIFICLINKSNDFPFYFQIGNSVIALITIFSIKHETRERKLDGFIEDGIYHSTAIKKSCKKHHLCKCENPMISDEELLNFKNTTQEY